MGVGSPADPDVSLGVSPWVSLAPGLDLEGSPTVTSSTPIRISVPLDRGPPGDPPCWGGNGWRTREVQPEVGKIPDAQHELLLARVAAIDVAKAAGKVCVRLPGRAGRRVSRVWDVTAERRLHFARLSYRL